MNGNRFKQMLSKVAIVLGVVLIAGGAGRSHAQTVSMSASPTYAAFQQGVSAAVFDSRQAEQIWQDWQTRYPDSAVGPYYLGRALMAQGRSADAVSAFQRAVDRSPRHAIAHYALSTALRQNNQPEQAEDALEQAIALYPQDAAAHCDLAAGLRAQYRFTEAEAAARTSLLADPDYEFAWAGGWHRLCDLVRFSETAPLLEAAAAAHPTEAHWHYRLGAARDRKGDWAAAVAAYERAIAADPEYTDAYLRLEASQAQLREYQ